MDKEYIFIYILTIYILMAKPKKLTGHGAPVIKEGTKVRGTVISKYSNGVILSCENGAFDGVIMPKEARELEKGGLDLSL